MRWAEFIGWSIVLLTLSSRAVRASAVPLYTLNTLASFELGDACHCYADLIIGPDGSFYGTGVHNGAAGMGYIFRYDPEDSSLTRLASFIGSNGQEPNGDLVFGSDGLIYGTTTRGGATGQGNIFRFDPSNSQLIEVASFHGSNGALPISGLTPGADGILYGNTHYGGEFDGGTIFRFDPASAQLTSVASLNSTTGTGPYLSELLRDASGNFCGATALGGESGGGTVYRFDPVENSVTALGSFKGRPGPYAPLTYGADGALYGTTYFGDAFTEGTIYRLEIETGDLTTVGIFDGTNGQWPIGGLVADDAGNLFGVTQFGGEFDLGSVFHFDPPSGVITTLVSFDGINGGGPVAGLTLDANGNLYGTTTFGGAYADPDTFNPGYGTIFQLSPGLIGDFNNDDTVNAADYVVWRNGLGTIYTQDDYEVWRSHFGQSAGSGSVLPSAGPPSTGVPEPASWLLSLGLGALAICFRSARRR